MRNFVALAVILVATFAQKDAEDSEIENIWSLSRRSLKVDSSEFSQEVEEHLGDESEEDYESYYGKIRSRPSLQRYARYRYNIGDQEKILERRYIEDELDDYDFEVEEEEDDEDKYRHDKKGKKKKKKKKKKGGGDDSEELEALKNLKKYVPPFWLGKQRPGWGNSHVEQVGWIIPKNVSPGDWKIWPSGWTSGQGLGEGELKWVDGKGWVGTVGAPWRQSTPPQLGPGYGWIEEDEDYGKKGKKKKKKKKDKKHKKDKKKKKKKKKKKNQGDPCERSGRGGGKGKKKRGGGGEEKCQKGPMPWFGWPEKIKFVPPPPRGSQIWLKNLGPAPVKSGWSDYHGWNWKSKLFSGWGVSDLVGVVHL